ncbi:NCS1 family nucleobase:cation symporter-1 [Friedmanniella endophytica]|uniref:NCS1 family nucleobase:cation symporter-1 n=1 Tax=Microlunatus kandeliicorticis TaxID=1759536 RepID=A0A7W3P7K3_9ACTN|nr:NCS1 family nucleobase:cation symporter-1 [Microlunatus kandeliicorticis]MBA8796080.1 NCS1 family nucleobase:cation symporter-1 [Microlunatus kandeliicorticis]
MADTVDIGTATGAVGAPPSPRPGDHPAGPGVLKPSYSDRLANEDLAPLRKQTWSSYNIFAFWMSDVHSVGGYLTAGTLFSLGIASWQVLISLLVGITIVMVFCNLVAKPSQITSVPYPVINRAIFGVLGANLPAIVRGLIAVAWYGVQTYLASQSLIIIFLKFIPGSAALNSPELAFLGLPPLGYIAYAILWVAQAAVFWRGMEAIRRFIDWAGPAVYVVMVIMAVYLVAKAGLGNLDLSLGSRPMGVGAQLATMLVGVAIVVSYFSGPMLNFGDFSRYGRDFRTVRRGNLLGLPLNFLFFSLLTVITAAATVPVFKELVTDPIETVQRIGTPFAVLLGGLTFVTATVGINIVANFISPAFDFSNVSPKKISWRMGGMIAAVGSVLLTPWNWYSSNTGILFSLGILGALIGPLFGILIAGYFLVSKQRVWVDDLYTLDPKGRYWFRNGTNPNAILAVVLAGVPSIAMTLIAGIVDGGRHHIGEFSWFLGCGLGFVFFTLLERRRPMIGRLEEDRVSATDGTVLPSGVVPTLPHASGDSQG